MREMTVRALLHAAALGREGAAPFPDVPWAEAVAKGHAEVKGEWFWEYSADDLDMIRDGETIRPRARYRGAEDLAYTPLYERG